MTKVTARALMNLLKAQGHCCALTGRPLDPSTCSMDHVVPYSVSRCHELENIQLLHKQVNGSKGSMTNEEFIQLCREVVRHVDAKCGE